MKIDFQAMAEAANPQFCGGEGVFYAKMFTDDLSRILRGRLDPGSSIGLHTHETSSEIIYILSGTGKVKYDESEEPLKAGDCHYCPKGHAHSLINNSDGPLEFFAVIPNQ